MTTPLKVLRIDSSARKAGSITRQLTDAYIDTLSQNRKIDVTTRDLSDGLPFLDEAWVGANFTAEEDRTDAQRETLALSDQLISELKDADLVVFGQPIYNFGVPSVLKAWIDLIARARVTFRYTDQGPVGLLENKRAVILVASGGTAADSEIDFATPYLRHALGFVGITDVSVIAADQLGQNGHDKIAARLDDIRTLAAATFASQRSHVD